MEAKIKGRITIRTAALFFVLSAVLELLSVATEVPLFGAVRSGAAAMIYHSLYVAVFLVIGVGLWRAKPWGYWAVMGATALYTVDKAQFLLSRAMFESYILRTFAATPEVFDMVQKQEVFQVVELMYIVFILCWWGFALYIHWRRAYFVQSVPPQG